MSVRVRIAPSPTGDPHVGTAFMALFNYVFARHNNGKFILRIEDTDQARSRPEYEESVYRALHWCHISWDEGPDVGGDCGPYRQSERSEIYKKHVYDLVEAGKAYKCFATPEELEEMREVARVQKRRQGYDRRYRNLSAEEIREREGLGQAYTIRVKIPLSGECIYHDQIKGRVSCPWADVDDQILLKSDGFPTYHLANVVDDHLMKITHVIRGDEWMASTPKHIYLYEAFGWEAPIFLHMPLLLGVDGKKLSKRKNPTSIFYYRDSGYLPEAFTNFLSLMGYSMADEREMYDIETLIAEFDVRRIGVSGAVFDTNKLDWLNQQYIIQKIPEEQLWSRIKAWSFSDAFMERLMPLCHTRIKTFADFMGLFAFLFVNDMHYNATLFQVKEFSPQQVAYLLQAVIWDLEERQDWSGDALNQGSREVAEAFGVNHKKVVMPLLFGALIGKRQGPPLFASVDILGKDRMRARFLQAIVFLGGISNHKIRQLQKSWETKDCVDWLRGEE